ncbi:MAG: Lrp/AsnC family transcriptional regulator [Candidatus Marinimicrobia bacterium]|nr:Lrp/AsnC family transcriptional regulator [Candidatus Neomarinimicrobiota bacterium]
MKLDKTDIMILNVLREDGRIPNTELAKKIGLSPGPTLERMKKLERNGTITGYYAKLDAEKIGFGVQTFVEAVLSRHKKDNILEFMEAVKNIPEIIGCYHITGKADFLLKVYVENIKDYEDFLLHTLSTLPGLQHVETFIVMRCVKNEPNPPVK